MDPRASHMVSMCPTSELYPKQSPWTVQKGWRGEPGLAHQLPGSLFSPTCPSALRELLLHCACSSFDIDLWYSALFLSLVCTGHRKIGQGTMSGVGVPSGQGLQGM